MRFPGTDDNKRVNRWLDRKQFWKLEEGLKGCRHLNSETAKRIIDNTYARFVINNINSFDPEVLPKIAVSLVEHRDYILVLDNLDKFGPRIDVPFIFGKIAEQLKDSHHLIHRLEGLCVTHAPIVDRILDSNFPERVPEHMYLFNDVDHNKIAKKLIKLEKTFLLAEHLAGFKGLDGEVAVDLIKEGYAREVKDNFNIFASAENVNLIRSGVVGSDNEVFVLHYIDPDEGVRAIVFIGDTEFQGSPEKAINAAITSLANRPVGETQQWKNPDVMIRGLNNAAATMPTLALS